jgi:hypothetical protein
MTFIREWVLGKPIRIRSLQEEIESARRRWEEGARWRAQQDALFDGRPCPPLGHEGAVGEAGQTCDRPLEHAPDCACGLL